MMVDLHSNIPFWRLLINHYFRKDIRLNYLFGALLWHLVNIDQMWLGSFLNWRLILMSLNRIWEMCGQVRCCTEGFIYSVYKCASHIARWVLVALVRGCVWWGRGWRRQVKFQKYSMFGATIPCSVFSRLRGLVPGGPVRTVKSRHRPWWPPRWRWCSGRSSVFRSVADSRPSTCRLPSFCPWESVWSATSARNGQAQRSYVKFFLLSFLFCAQDPQPQRRSLWWPNVCGFCRCCAD